MNVLFISLGCDKNLVDSEKMLGILKEAGYQITDNEENADVIVINTCCFIGDAKEESIETILEMAQWKEKGSLKALVVTGCLAQRYRDEILRELPEIDAVIGTTGYEKIVEAIEEALTGKKAQKYEELSHLPMPRVKRLQNTGTCTAYLKIAEGCDKCCTYCIIPKVRGHYRSVPMEELISETEQLAGQGIKELILVAQETTLYGVDLYGKKMLPELLRRLCGVQGIVWIRLLYCYPEEITDDLIEVIREEEKICHYLDLPIQHASDDILRRMGRRTSRADIESIVEKLRQNIPDIVLRTTLITGFPGETRNQHNELKEFIKNMHFERLGVFPYSQEEDTPAADMQGQIAEDVKKARYHELMEIQQAVVFKQAQKLKGRRIQAMIEGKLQDEDVYVARTYMDTPGVDSCVFVECPYEIISGDFMEVQITGVRGYDLIAELCE